MNPKSIDRIFCDAAQIASPVEREAFLDQACGGDVRLHQKVEGLLKLRSRAEDFLESPPAVLGVTVDEPPVLEQPGAVIGPYKLLEQIGEGGFGVVFMAEQSKPIQRKVALKIIKPGMDTRQVITRFEAERQALALMDHPNIAKVLEAGMTDNGRPYFVMELVRGVPVTDYCDQKSLSIRERLGLFIMICQAVQHAHQKGIIHRDIKPTNVLVTQQDGRPLAKVIDFGVAKATGQKLTEKTLFTGFAQLIGTPLYMSPEQAELSAEDVDTRTDIYSLGVLLYELLTGSTPFDKGRLKNATFDELRRIIREEEPPRPSTRLSTLAQQAISTVSTQRSSDPRHLSRLFQGELDWIVMKSLEKDRNRRYETASALAADVERYLQDEPVQACPPSGLYRVRKFVRRNSVGVAMATAIGVGLLIAVTGAAWVLRDHSAREAAMEQEISQALKDSITSFESGKLTEAVSALKRAEGLLASGGASGVVQQRVESWRTDLQTVDRLEQIRIDQAGRSISVQREQTDPSVSLPPTAMMDPIVRRMGGTDANSIQETESRTGVWDRDTADRAYQQEFQRYGIDSGTLDIEKAAKLIRNSPIRQTLVAALDDWFHATQSDRKTSSGRKELLQIARLADPDPWRDRLRDAIGRGDDAVLAKLATESDSIEQPLPTVLLLVRALQSRKPRSVSSEGAAILRQVQRRHPNDFWINAELANCLPKSQIADEVGFRRVAVALRPESAGAQTALAERLHDQGNDAEAEAVALEATRLNPGYSTAFVGLAQILEAEGKEAGAEAAWRDAIRLSPDTLKWSDRLYQLLMREQKYAEALPELLRVIAAESKATGVSWGHFIASTEVLDSLAAQGKTPPEELAADFVRAMDLTTDDRTRWSARPEFFRRLGRWDDVLDRVAKLRPQETALWVGRGQYRAMHGQWHEALRDFARVLNNRIEVDTNWETINYAGLLILDGDIAGYKGFCQRLKARVGDHPADAWVAYIVSQVLAIGPIESADRPRILEWAEQGAQTSPYNLGLAQFRAGHYVAAIESLQTAIDLGYFPVLGRLVQAMVYDRWGHPGMRHVRIEETKDLIADAMPSSAGDEGRINPAEWIELNVLSREAEALLKHGPGQMNIGAPAENALSATENQSALAQRNAELDEAAAEYVRTIDESQDTWWSGSPRKRVCRYLARWDEVFERVTKLRPEEPTLWIGRAQNRALRNQWAEAASDYAKVTHTSYVSWEFHEYASILLMQGDKQKYQKFCRDLLTRLGEPRDAETATCMARAFAIGSADAVAPEHVVQWAEQGLTREDTFPWRVHVLGLAHYRAGQYDLAVKDARKAIGMPSNSSIMQSLNWLVLTMADYRLGRTAEALQTLENARKLIKQVSPKERDEPSLESPADWTEMHALLRETETLLQSAPNQQSSGAPQKDAVQATENKQAK